MWATLYVFNVAYVLYFHKTYDEQIINISLQMECSSASKTQRHF